MKLPNFSWITLRWMPIIPSPAATPPGLCDTTHVKREPGSISSTIAGWQLPGVAVLIKGRRNIDIESRSQAEC
jgi:hypothetical protein